MYDLTWYQEEAIRNYGLYMEVQKKVSALEANALRSAGGSVKAQSQLLGDARTEAGFEYKIRCQQRTTYQTITLLNVQMAIMMQGRMASVPMQRQV